jgi:hypothetical protein
MVGGNAEQVIGGVSKLFDLPLRVGPIGVQSHPECGDNRTAFNTDQSYPQKRITDNAEADRQDDVLLRGVTVAPPIWSWPTSYRELIKGSLLIENLDLGHVTEQRDAMLYCTPDLITLAFGVW